MSPIKFTVWLKICSYDQSLVTLAFPWEMFPWEKFQFLGIWPEKHFFKGWSWFKLNNLQLLPEMALIFYSSVIKGLKLKVKKFYSIIPVFGEVTHRNLEGGGLFTNPFLE